MLRSHNKYPIHLEAQYSSLFTFHVCLDFCGRFVQSKSCTPKHTKYLQMSAWTCSICGKVNNGMLHKNCIACGREKGTNVVDSWTCRICGKVHHDNDGKTQIMDCSTCGRKKGYVGSKPSSGHHIMPATPQHAETKLVEPRDNKSFVANQSIFLSTKHDYEANARMGLVDEMKSVLASIHHTLQND